MPVPDHETDTVIEQITQLLAATPPAARWAAIRRLRTHLPLLQQLTVSQLAGEDLASVGRQLNVTKSWVSQLRTAAPEEGPWATWGRALATAGALADLAEQPGSCRLADEFTDLLTDGLSGSPDAIRPRVEDTTRRWAAAARRRRKAEVAEHLLGRLAQLLDAVVPVGECGSAQRAELLFAFHAHRATLRGEVGWPPALDLKTPTTAGETPVRLMPVGLTSYGPGQ